jgi:hypothetical protein
MLGAGRKLHPVICYEMIPGYFSDSTHQYYKLHKVKRQGKDRCAHANNITLRTVVAHEQYLPAGWVLQEESQVDFRRVVLNLQQSV